MTGVPDPKDDHAVVMAKFAEECRFKTNKVLTELVSEFGTSVNSLSMRFGMHSGSVTAGVLRGSKSRFELFGDTINTASRMESTGRPNKIQISTQTAQLLEDSGLSHWFTPREDLVFAKGKGELQTFWLEISSNPKSESTQSPFPVKLLTDAQQSFVHGIYKESQSIDGESDIEISNIEGIDPDSDAFDENLSSRRSSSSSIFVGTLK